MKCDTTINCPCDPRGCKNNCLHACAWMFYNNNGANFQLYKNVRFETVYQEFEKWLNLWYLEKKNVFTSVGKMKMFKYVLDQVLECDSDSDSEEEESKYQDLMRRIKLVLGEE